MWLCHSFSHKPQKNKPNILSIILKTPQNNTMSSTIPQSFEKQLSCSSYALSTVQSSGGNSDISNNNILTRTTVVSFGPRIKVKKTLGLSDFSKDEISNIWYDETELEDIRLEIYATVQHLTVNIDSDENEEEEECLRGLEHQLQISHARNDVEHEEPEVENMKVISRKLVLTEQSLQRSQGIQDPDKIALAYGAAVKCCTATARARGEMDGIFIQTLQAQEEEEKLYPQSKEEMERKDQQQQQKQLGEFDACENRAMLLLARRREHMRRRVAGTAA